MVVLGGMGSLAGAIGAAAVLTVLPELLRHVDLSGVGLLPAALRRPLSEYNQLLFAVLLIVMIRLVPDGLLGMRETPAFVRRRRSATADAPPPG
jgi:branched-chain amino acid transport system permease protein